MKIFDKECFIILPQEFNGNTKIYKGYPKILKEDIKEDYIYYIFDFCNCEFGIHLKNDDLHKVYHKSAFIKDNSETIGETRIIFSLSKENILKFYENKLNEIEEILNIKKQQLSESIKAISDQKIMLYNKSESLFVDEKEE